MHRRFIWLVVASYFVAALLPQFGLWIRTASLGFVPLTQGRLEASLPSIMLASLLFNAGLGVRLSDLKQLIHGPGPLLAGLVANLTLPVTYIFVVSQVMRLWHNSEEVQHILVGLALVASMPIAGSSTAWTQNANGNLALSLGLVLFSTILSPLATPLVLHAVGLMTTGDYSEDLHELASGGVGSFLGVWVILPSLAGIAARLLAGENRMAIIRPYLKLVNWAVLLLLNYSNASLSLPKAVAEPDFDYLAVMLVLALSLCAVAFTTGWGIARVLRTDRDQRVSMMFALGMNNNGAGLVLASIALADHPQVMLPIIFYNLVQHLVAASVDALMFRDVVQETD
ncbi:Sodium Bile acid symporter family protein [Lignipirellula cremea]|uniref:Sodium Bile acid symporter family protein n=1 Tax=Lignipirellula cremea TaxID=2528010 RepID=A0A518DL19_9BACT|nr:Sodium Bile acid symporter family protein [Lignipirellula cremea]